MHNLCRMSFLTWDYDNDIGHSHAAHEAGFKKPVVINNILLPDGWWAHYRTSLSKSVRHRTTKHHNSKLWLLRDEIIFTPLSRDVTPDQSCVQWVTTPSSPDSVPFPIQNNTNEWPLSWLVSTVKLSFMLRSNPVSLAFVTTTLRERTTTAIKPLWQ